MRCEHIFKISKHKLKKQMLPLINYYKTLHHVLFFHVSNRVCNHTSVSLPIFNNYSPLCSQDNVLEMKLSQLWSCSVNFTQHLWLFSPLTFRNQTLDTEFGINGLCYSQRSPEGGTGCYRAGSTGAIRIKGPSRAFVYSTPTMWWCGTTDLLIRKKNNSAAEEKLQKHESLECIGHRGSVLTWGLTCQ